MGLDQLFGPSVPLPARFIIVFVIVLALMAIFFWILRRVFGGGLVSGMGRRAEQRIHVSEAVNLDGRRKLLIIRRDSVEHLVMIGGPNDVVIESQFTRSQPLLVPRDEAEPPLAARPRPETSRLEAPRMETPRAAEPEAPRPAPAPPLPPLQARPQPAPTPPPRPQPIPPVARPAAAVAPAAPVAPTAPVAPAAPVVAPAAPAPAQQAAAAPEPPARPATPADIEREMANLLGAFQKPPAKP